MRRMEEQAVAELVLELEIKRQPPVLPPSQIRGAVLLHSPSFLLFQIPASPPHWGFGKGRHSLCSSPHPTPNWQLLACCLCPDMAEGHWQPGDGVDFPFGSMEEEEGKA